LRNQFFNGELKKWDINHRRLNICCSRNAFVEANVVEANVVESNVELGLVSNSITFLNNKSNQIQCLNFMHNNSTPAVL